MGLTPRQKITVWRDTLTRDSRVFVICYLNFGGREYLFSTDQLQIESTDKNIWLPVKPGLISELDIGESINIGLRESQLQSASVSVWNRDEFQNLRTSIPLTRGQAEISLWIEGITWEERLILLDGLVRSPSWGEPDDSFDFEILPKQLFIDRDFPTLQITDTRFPNAPDSSMGDPYPIIFGEVQYVKCPYVDNASYKYLIAGHECYAAPSKITLANYDGISRQQVFSSACSATTDFDCTTSGAGTWAAAAGRVAFSHNATATGHAFLIDSNGDRIQSYNQIIKTRARFVAPEADTSSRLGFLLRYEDDDNLILVYLRRDNGGDSYVRILYRAGGVDYTDIVNAITSLSLDTDYDLAVRLDGNRTTVFLDGEEIANAEHECWPMSGDSGIYARHETAGTNASASFDWVKFPVTIPTYSLTTDGEANSVYLATFSDNLGEGTDVYADDQGKVDSDGNLIENPAEVIENIASLHTGLTADFLDSAAFGRAKSKLSSWKFASIFQGSGSTKGTAFSTISQRLIRQLPLIPVWRENTYSIEYIDYDREDVSAYLSRSRNIIQLVGRIREGPIEDIANTFKIKYGYSQIEGRFLKYSERSPANSSRCKLSRNKYGEREYPTLEAYDIQDDATAEYLLNYLERTYTEPPVMLTYELTKDQSFLEANRLVCVIDSNQGWDDKKFLIEQIKFPGESVLADLRSV